ncbi:acyl-CoA dehydrogenase [Frankia sp. R43]|nr:acyl-CoA dehydrogenase [Frankia sp. R43]
MAQKSPEAEVRRLMATTMGYDPATWASLGHDLGLVGILVPPELGGAGATFVELSIVLEEMGRRLFCGPYLSTAVLAVTTLLESGDETAQRRWLPGIATGDTVATLALTEDDGRWDEGGITVTATPDGTGWALSGAKQYVLDGHTADLVLTAARTTRGVSLFAVPGDAPGMSRTPMTTLDQTRKQARIELNDAPATLIGADGHGWPVLERVLDAAAVALAAEQAGGARFALDMTVQYAKDRIQFGRPIGSFQAIKHSCADTMLEVESATSAARYAAWCAATHDDLLAEVSAIAGTYCSDAYLHAASACIQIHGGMGFTWEHPAHLYYRRAASSRLLFGAPDHWRSLLADRIGS